MADVDQVETAGGEDDFFRAELFGKSGQVVKFDDFGGVFFLKMVH